MLLRAKKKQLYSAAGVPAIVANGSRLDAIPQDQEPTKGIAHPQRRAVKESSYFPNTGARYKTATTRQNGRCNSAEDAPGLCPMNKLPKTLHRTKATLSLSHDNPLIDQRLDIFPILLS